MVLRLRRAVVVLAAVAGLCVTLGYVGGGLHAKVNRPRGAYAIARVHGGPLVPGISGTVEFRAYRGGTMVSVRVTGLPSFKEGNPPIGPFGFHVHELGDCEAGDGASPFPKSGMHYNPDGQPHPNHAGDLPVLFSSHGRAVMDVYTDRFTPKDVIGRSVIIHQNPDDYRTQPSGASGLRMACGLIERAK